MVDNVYISGLYSMEGTMCNLPAIVELKKKYKVSVFIKVASQILTTLCTYFFIIVDCVSDTLDRYLHLLQCNYCMELTSFVSPSVQHKHTHTHKHTQTQTHTHTNTHAQTHTYTQTQTHKHTQTQTHTHTHTHKCFNIHILCIVM